MPINKLQKEVDVYCKWVDEAEEIKRKRRQGQTLGFQQGATENADQDVEYSPERPSLRQGGTMVGMKRGRKDDDEDEESDEYGEEEEEKGEESEEEEERPYQSKRPKTVSDYLEENRPRESGLGGAATQMKKDDKVVNVQDESDEDEQLF